MLVVEENRQEALRGVFEIRNIIAASVLLLMSLTSILIYIFAKSLLKQTSELAKFKLAVENATDHIIITDPNGIILYANPAVCLITGYDLQEIIGARPSLWGKQMPKKFYKNMWETIKTKKQSYTGELKNKRKNGEVYDV